jgi:predicted Zn-dependent protease
MINSKRWILGVVAVALLAFGLWKIPSLYGRVVAERALGQARAYAEKGDRKNTLLSLQTSLRARRENPEAYEMLAALMEAESNPEAVSVRQMVVQLRPGEPEALLALARTALRFGHADAAESSLKALPASFRENAEYWELQGQTACAQNDLPGAEAAVVELQKRNPQELRTRNLELAVAELQGQTGDLFAQKRAAATLDRLASDPVLGSTALRRRKAALRRSGDLHAALESSERLIHRPDCTDLDRMEHLELQDQCRAPGYAATLQELQHKAQTDPACAAALARFILDRHGAQDALQWLDHVPTDIRKKLPVPIVVADCYLALKDWKALETLVTGANWGRMEAQRLTLVSIVFRQRGEAAMASHYWGLARKTARGQTASQLFLYQQQMEAGRPDEAHDLLWDIPRGDPRYEWAQKELFTYYQGQKNATGLVRFFERRLQDYPDQLSVKLDLAQFLLVAGQNPVHAATLAAEVYKADPQPLVHAAVYAYSLCVNGDPKRAAAVLDARKQDEFRDSPCLIYYGLILAACQRETEARDCFNRMDRTILYPEMKIRVEGWERRWAEALKQAADAVPRK